MGFSTKVCLFSAALLATSVQGHMKMKTPAPYGGETLNNSPLDASGSDFPCKQRPGVYAMPAGGSTVMAHGEQQTLSFTGSAVHGGGSCQIALSKDTQPTKDSKWMVIKSIIGGCPANVPGNLPEDANGSGASTFQYSIPDGIEPGDYALSWTWFNKVGNREMYQNCAPVTVTASRKRRQFPRQFPRHLSDTSKSRRDTTSSYPDIFKCCVGEVSGGCITPDNSDLVFPDPGAVVETAGSGPFATVAGMGSSPQQTQTSPATVPSETAPIAPTTTAYGGGNGGGGGSNGGDNGSGNGGNNGGNAGYTVSPAGFAEGASSATGSSGGVTPVASDGTPLSTSAPVASNASEPTSNGGSCTAGDWECAADGLSFKRCVVGGTWSAAIPMSAGMHCIPGISANFQQTAVKNKRHAHSHFRHVLDSFHL